MVYPFAIHLNLFNYCFLHNSFCRFWPPVEVKLCSCPVLFFILFLISLIVVYSCKLEGCIGCKWQVVVGVVYRLDLSEKRKGSTLCRTQLAPLDPPQNTAEHISKDSYIFVKTYLRRGKKIGKSEEQLRKQQRKWGTKKVRGGTPWQSNYPSEGTMLLEHEECEKQAVAERNCYVLTVTSCMICCLIGGTGCNLWWQQGRTRNA